MNAAENKRLVQGIFDELAKGNSRPFGAALSDDFAWIITGHGPWSGTWRGREVVREKLLAPLFAQFATPYRNTADLLIAEGDRVVVLCRGDVWTHAGDRYDNHYCYVIRLKDGQLVELIEYMDTQLIHDVLSPPQPAEA